MGGLPVLRLSGEVDIATTARLRPSWLALADATCPPLIVVDLSAVTFIDVAGVGLLVALRNRQRRHGGRVHLTCVPPVAARVLALTGLAGSFPVETAPRPRSGADDVVDLRALETEHQLRDS